MDRKKRNDRPDRDYLDSFEQYERTEMMERRAERKKKARRRRRNKVLWILIFFLIMLMLLGGSYFWIKYGPSKRKADLQAYFNVTQKDQLAIVVNNENVKVGGKMYDGKPFVEYKVLRDYINERFYWDTNENTLLYTLPTKTVAAVVGKNEYQVGTEKETWNGPIVKAEGSEVYVSLDFVQKYTNMEYRLYKDPSRAVIDTRMTRHLAELKKDGNVRVKAGVKSPILTTVDKGSKVDYIEPLDSWVKVRTDNGMIGYIPGGDLKSSEKVSVKRDFKEPKYTNIQKKKTINLAWNMVTSQAANKAVLETIAKSKGLTTLSPTWFSVADTEGNIVSIASPEYVNYAHKSGIEVWAMVNDFDHGFGGLKTPEEIYEVLGHTSKRERLINQLVGAALQSGVDGINVDFEHIYTKDAGYDFIQFIRELSVKCRQNNLVLSVDNYVPQGYNTQYHRKEQGKVADYVIIMAYDEHQKNSLESGSVDSYDFVKQGIERTLEEVPKEKVINGMALYTRLWKERPKTQEEIESDANKEAAAYKNKISCSTLGMEDAQKAVDQAGVKPKWDDQIKQEYATWKGTDGEVYKIWLQNGKSIEWRLRLMKEKKLAGVATWRLGYETPDIWELILKYVN